MHDIGGFAGVTGGSILALIWREILEAAHGALPVVELDHLTAVEDASPGIQPADRERIFERFARGDAAGRRGEGDGTGLGLSLVREHVRLHGGRVWVDDAAGGGARFVVQLPLTG